MPSRDAPRLQHGATDIAAQGWPAPAHPTKPSVRFVFGGVVKTHPKWRPPTQQPRASVRCGFALEQLQRRESAGGCRRTRQTWSGNPRPDRRAVQRRAAWVRKQKGPEPCGFRASSKRAWKGAPTRHLHPVATGLHTHWPARCPAGQANRSGAQSASSESQSGRRMRRARTPDPMRVEG